MADTDRAEFPDYEHPLFTPDTDAQAAVVERIKLAMNTGERRPRQHTEPHVETDADGRRVLVLDDNSAWDGFIFSRPTRYVRESMGERYRVTQTDLAAPWGVGQSRVSELINHPEKLDKNKTFILHHMLGVTLDWLRGWTDVNAYGRYEDNPQVVAKLYDRLSPYDKEHVCYMLMSLLGADEIKDVYEAENKPYMDAWWAAHPDEAKEFEETMSKPFSSLDSIMLSVAEASTVIVRQMNQAIAQSTIERMRETARMKYKVGSELAEAQRANEQRVREMGHLTTGAALLAQQAAQQTGGRMGALAEQAARAAKERADQPTAGPTTVDEP